MSVPGVEVGVAEAPVPPFPPQEASESARKRKSSILYRNLFFRIDPSIYDLLCIVAKREEVVQELM